MRTDTTCLIMFHPYELKVQANIVASMGEYCEFSFFRDFYDILVPNQTDLFASPGSHLSSLFLITTKIPDFCSAKQLTLLPEPKRGGSKNDKS